MLRRGLKTLDELKQVEESERKEAELAADITFVNSLLPYPTSSEADPNQVL
jgi:hypothetical protein